MPKQRKRLCLRCSLRAFLIVLTVFCIWLGWRVNRAQRQQTAMELLKAKGTFLYHNQEDAMAIVMRRVTGTLAYGDVREIVLSHDTSKPLQIEFDPQDIDLLKDLPYLTTLHIYSSQREETIVRLGDIGSLELVGLYMHDANDLGVVTLKKLRPDLKVVTK